MRNTYIAILILGLIGVTTFAVYKTSSLTLYDSGDALASSTSGVESKPKPPEILRVPTPPAVKAIYMSQCVVGTPTFREKLVKLVDETELNSIIVDIKDFTGKISFQTENPVLADSVSTACGAYDMKDFIKYMHEKDIYVIGRITVFQDPYYTSKHPELAVQSKSRPGEPWKDDKGLSFIDVSSKQYWDYVIELSKESYALGFDELNYDYIRYPSDGDMDDAVYVNPNKAEALEEFFAFLYKNVKPMGAVMSADLFGMTMVSKDHLGIGQILEKALPYFDYIAPMVYPSHYPSYYLGLGNPNKNPYAVVHHSMTEGVARTIAPQTEIYFIGAEPASDFASTSLYMKPIYDRDKLRPWLQDFDYGGNYGPEEVRAQIRATNDAGLDSWMLWSASNVYTREALEPFYNTTLAEDL